MINTSVFLHSDLIIELLTKIGSLSYPVLPKKFLKSSPFIFEFQQENKEFFAFDPHDTETFSNYVTTTLEKAGKILGVGKYGEDRTIYSLSPLYTKDSESRSVHLGIDLWVTDGTSVFVPLPARVHSFQVNDHFLDYGPTIILEHKIKGLIFYTLYGHLSKTSLKGLSAGKTFKAGERFAVVGNSKENGNWPSHLHFQIITDMLGKKGDFPGVAKPSEKEYYLMLCPDPNLILHLPT